MAVNLDFFPQVRPGQLISLFGSANDKSTLDGKGYRVLYFLDWDPNKTDYAIDDGVFYQGQPFKCTINGTRNPPSSLNGWAGVNDRGAWVAGGYSRLDKVTYNGSTYIAIRSTTARPLDLSGNSSVDWEQMWLSCLNRLRGNLLNKFSGYKNKTWVSGPWPVTDTNSLVYGGFSGVGGVTVSNINSVDFYYAAAAGTAVINLTWDGTVASNDPAQSSVSLSSTAKFLLQIGGSSAATFNGKFVIRNFIGPDVTTAGCTTNFPGATFTNVAGVLSATVSGVSVNPGIYEFNCTFSGAGGYFSGSYLDCDTNGTSIRARLTVAVPGSATEVPGIHNTLKVWRQVCPQPDTLAGYQFGVYSYFLDSSSGKFDWFSGASGSIYDATPQKGIWVGYTAPINDLQMRVNTLMPWNLMKLPDGTTPGIHDAPPQNLNQPYKVSGSDPYTYTPAYSAPWEKQNMPAAWVASTWYQKGFKIMDSNGNIQMVLTAGKSGLSEPTWKFEIDVPDLDRITNDGTIQWRIIKIPDPKFTRARARTFSVPAYPIIWENDTWQAGANVSLGQKIMDTNGEIRICSQAGTTAATQPAWGSGGSATIVTPNWGMEGTAAEITDGTAKWRPYMAGFKPLGWWIYRVNINRVSESDQVGAGTATAGAGDPSPGAGGNNVPVVIGCYRNGSFVSFGNFLTGTSFKAMWPIFTNTPLVYQCAERVDIQASIIACGNNFTTGTNINYPIAAAFYDDTETLLKLIQ